MKKEQTENMEVLRFAGIDIGTNAVRLLIVNIMQYGDEYVKSKASFIRIPLRLGFETFGKGKISKKKIKELVKTMKAFKHIMQVYKVKAFRACATSAMREAKNGEKVIQSVLEQTGIEIKLISGIEEAQLIYGIGSLTKSEKDQMFLSADLGGGSLELTLFSNKKIIASNSFKIGTIRYLNNMIDETERTKFKQWLTELIVKHGVPSIIGSGGNINKISKIARLKSDENLKREHILEIFNLLEPLSIKERIKVYQINPDRADVIVPAAQVFIELMNITGADEVIVPKIGLADGIINLLHEKYLLKSKK